MLKTITPINNTTYVERDYANAQEIEKALENSKKVFLSWKQTPLNERKEILTKFVDSFLLNNTYQLLKNKKFLMPIKPYSMNKY